MQLKRSFFFEMSQAFYAYDGLMIAAYFAKRRPILEIEVSNLPQFQGKDQMVIKAEVERKIA
jgi:hypothetical protein